MARRIPIVYVTSSPFKIEENEILTKEYELSEGRLVGDLFEFDIREVAIQEVLEVSIERMVREEVKLAYEQLKVPCIVEHAGLIFKDYKGDSYPGGLTKPMWDTLGDNFISETRSADREAIAQAVVAYCDGKEIHAFSGEVAGTLAPEPVGSRAFYWDTVFRPTDQQFNPEGKTYAQIFDDVNLGLRHKVLHLSQSTKALVEFLEYRLSAGSPELWPHGRR